MDLKTTTDINFNHFLEGGIGKPKWQQSDDLEKYLQVRKVKINWEQLITEYKEYLGKK